MKLLHKIKHVKSSLQNQGWLERGFISSSENVLKYEEKEPQIFLVFND